MEDRQRESALYDVAVIGGGINGCGIAADAAGRGLDVLLVEQGDLAQGTSSASSKLIHGGLRYLEHYDFRLVHESLAEREVLLANAPHIVWPLRFIVPHVPQMRSRILMRMGLFLYDHLARRHRVPASGTVDLTRDPAARLLSGSISQAFHYWDCWVDDARLVVSVAKLAEQHGATILTRTALAGAVADRDGWTLRLEDRSAPGGEVMPVRQVRARTLVNAAGPWVAEVDAMIRRGGGLQPRLSPPPVRLVKGSHIVVPRIAGADDAFLLQAPDKRVVFLLPFAETYTLIGTTDVPVTSTRDARTVTEAEVDYLLGVANRFLDAPLAASQIVWRFAGARALYDDANEDASAVTRDYRLVLDAPGGSAPLLTVVGGKVTTYRKLGEAGVDLVATHCGKRSGPRWTHAAALPGGEIPAADFETYAAHFVRERPGFAPRMLRRLLRRYGTRTSLLLGAARHADDLGAHLGAGLSEREVAYLVTEEWARTPEDILWRRTKAGLGLTPAELVAAEKAIGAAIARTRS